MIDSPQKLTKETFNKYVDKAINQMFMNEYWRPFAIALMAYDIRYSEVTPMDTCITFDKYILINPNCFIFDCIKNVNNAITFVLLHEISHPLNKDAERVKDRDKDAEELDLFERVEFTDEELEEMYANDNHRKELTTNMDEEEWQ